MSEAYKPGYNIEVNDKMYFVVSGPGFEDLFGMDRNTFESAGEARRAIDGMIQMRAKAAPLNLKVRDPRGKVYEITGINLHSSDFTSKPVSNSRDTDEFYVIHPAIMLLIKERGQLRKRLAAIEAQLEKCQITRDRGNVRLETYAEYIETLQKEFATATAYAAKRFGAK